MQGEITACTARRADGAVHSDVVIGLEHNSGSCIQNRLNSCGVDRAISTGIIGKGGSTYGIACCCWLKYICSPGIRKSAKINKYRAEHKSTIVQGRKRAAICCDVSYLIREMGPYQTICSTHDTYCAGNAIAPGHRASINAITTKWLIIPTLAPHHIVAISQAKNAIYKTDIPHFITVCASNQAVCRGDSADQPSTRSRTVTPGDRADVRNP